MKVLITGCARSGTTLMIHLMKYFYSAKVILDDEKHPYDYYSHNDKDHVLIIKKPYQEINSIEHFSIHTLMNKQGWKVIWMLRDGRDVITSKVDGSFHVKQRRWVEANEDMLKNWNDCRLKVIRYEDLVNHTDKTMGVVSDFIHQSYQEDFKEFYKGMDDSKMNYGITPRPIDVNSVGNYKNYPEVIENAMNHISFVKLLNLFGYL